MRRCLLVAVLLAAAALAACASTYNMPEGQRSRSYDATPAAVWEAAIAAVGETGLAITETETEHGRIRARQGGTFWDLKGHLLLVVIRDQGDGRVRVDANAENVTADDPVDFGESKRIVRRYLEALDARMM